MVVYLITNTVNGKVYVGKTCKTAERRWIEHLSGARVGRKRMVIYSAIRKYGIDAFTVTTLSRHDSVKDMAEAEIAAIVRYNSADRNVGYNITPGGDGAPTGNTYRSGTNHSELSKQKMRSGHLGVKRGPMSETHRQRISAAMQGKQNSKGRCISQETRAKMSNAATGRRMPAELADRLRTLSLGRVPWNKGLSLSAGTLVLSDAAKAGMAKGIVNLKSRNSRKFKQSEEG